MNSDGTKEIAELLHAKAFDHSKPSNFIQKLLEFSTNPNDLILDSFAGSGTTAHAVLNLNKQDGGNRQFILIEMEDYAERITAERVRRVINGYGTTEGTGGDFTYYTLGEPLFDADKNISPTANIQALREYIYYSETKTPLSTKHVSGYFLGQYDKTTLYFCYEPTTPVTLDVDLLSSFDVMNETNIIYADNCLLSAELCKAKGIVFKKIPRDIRQY